MQNISGGRDVAAFLCPKRAGRRFIDGREGEYWHEQKESAGEAVNRLHREPENKSGR